MRYLQIWAACDLDGRLLGFHSKCCCGLPARHCEKEASVADFVPFVCEGYIPFCCWNYVLTVAVDGAVHYNYGAVCALATNRPIHAVHPAGQEYSADVDGV
ncbi:hypothetical protein FGB62_274g010 [Gracilaria domingensis]|nr:hypothetical protein FGB62_274g010 [Gracilaria domingensis]